MVVDTHASMVAETNVNEQAAASADPFVDQLVESVEQRIAATRMPEATYRLQFHRGFTFDDARQVVPYLAALGISDCYASPYLKAAPGSTHGYDIVDHNSLNPEIGSMADYEAFVNELHFHGMGQILDVVPNHMGVAGGDNAWWMDVLENGPGSAYASFFDIEWHPIKPDLANKVLLPVLGDQYGKVLEDQQLVLQFDAGAFYLQYFDHRYPIAPDTWGLILGHRVDELEKALGSEHPQMLEYRSILTAISHLPPRTETSSEKTNERRREKEVIQRRLTELCAASSETAEFIADNARIFNGERGQLKSFDLLDRLLLEQSYRLAFWRVAADEINYRRFFDVNSMAALRMEQPCVLQKTHELIMALVKNDSLNGLRIDHPDGLYDPAGYLQTIQCNRFLQLCREAFDALATPASAPTTTEAESADGAQSRFDTLEPQLRARFADISNADPNALMARPLYVTVEKILEPGERLPHNWQVNGTTGYDFLNALNGIFVDRTNARAFDSLYLLFSRLRTPFRELVYRCNKLIMQASMSSEVSVLGYQLDRLSEQNRRWRDFTLNSLTGAIREVIACFPVYRTYVNENGVLERDRRYIEMAVARARRRNPATSGSIFDLVREILLLQYPDSTDEGFRAAQRNFVGRFQQVTGPVMAKAVEDTAFYIYNRLVSLNEVGADPERFGQTVAAFHQQNLDRQANWPYGLLATSTHDTKRSEDVRARIDILSEIPQEWRARVFRWTRLNQSKKTSLDGELAPSRNEEYLLYQILVGSWPLETMDRAGRATYIERMQNYLLKATREAKINTSWISPNEAYERATHTFVAAILSDSPRNAFQAEMDSFARKVADCGMWSSLSQSLLKLASPGVPDFYQGTELWDDSLVDPDNRRPVDYAIRREMLRGLEERVDRAEGNLAELAQELVENRKDGRIKLYLIWRLLNYRREHPGLLTMGAYTPLESTGPRKENVCAFARRHGDNELAVVAPRLVTGISWGAPNPFAVEIWQDTRLHTPADFSPGKFWNLLTGEVVEWTANAGPLVAEILKSFPVAALARIGG